MAFELTGVILEIFPSQTFNKGFRKREFVIETGDKYPQKIIFGLVQDKCDMLDSYGVGDTVAVAFDVKGRDWTDKSGQVKYFNTLEAFRISGQQRAAIRSSAAEEEDDDDEIFRSLGIETGPKKSSAKQIDLDDDDLPF
jgi:Domain of unknown function (DUF3127)